jgi:hypothetical protein
MAHVNDANFDTYLARNQELSFLANALLAGCSVYDRPLTIQERGTPRSASATSASRHGRTARTLRRLPNRSLPNMILSPFETGWRLL